MQSPTCTEMQALSMLKACFLEVIFLLPAWASWDQEDIHAILVAACGWGSRGFEGPKSWV